MAENKFKLPGSSYEELKKIIRAYGQSDVPVSLSDISKHIGIDTTVISRNAGFLVELNILEPAGQQKASTSLGKSLAQALEHEITEEIGNCWCTVINSNDFTMKLISAVKIRNGMDESTLQAHIAYSAGQPKKSRYLTGAKTVIDIFLASGLIGESDGKYVVLKTDNSTKNSVYENDYTGSKPVTSEPSTSIPSIPISHEQSEVGIKININVNIECSASELDKLGEKISRVIEQVNSISST